MHSCKGNDQDGDPGGAGSGIIATVSVLLQTMDGSNQIDHLESLLGSLWPDQLEDRKKGFDYKTVYTVIAAAVQSKAHPEQRAPGSIIIRKIHINNLPKAPKTWNDLEKHPAGEYFKSDAKLEINNFEARNCWRIIPSNKASISPIPLKWVFIYKIDSDGYITWYYLRLVVRRDLQEEALLLSTYAAMLAARSFRVASAIAAHFDLEIKQFDIVNAFINTERDSNRPMVVCKLPDGFKVPGYIAEVD
jgi:hypothetical protein